MLNISIDQSLQKEFEKRDRLSGEPNISYQGKNFLVIDWAFLETVVETLENFIP